MYIVLSGYIIFVELIYELSHTSKRTIACVCVSFLAKYMPIIDNFVIGGGHFEFSSNHWREKMETVFLLICVLYISGKNHSFKINMNMTQNYTLTYTTLRIPLFKLMLGSQQI